MRQSGLSPSSPSHPDPSDDEEKRKPNRVERGFGSVLEYGEVRLGGVHVAGSFQAHGVGFKGSSCSVLVGGRTVDAFDAVPGVGFAGEFVSVLNFGSVGDVGIGSGALG